MAIVINGSGTVTGISVGGLPDGIVDSGTLADDAVVESKIGANAVVTAAINDDAVTNAKVAANAVAEAQLAANAVVTGKIEDGTIAAGDLASGVGGKVLQTTLVYDTGAVLGTISGWVDINLTSTITPISLTSKMLVEWKVHNYNNTGGTSAWESVNVRLVDAGDGDTVLWTDDSNHSLGGHEGWQMSSGIWNFYHDHNKTVAIVYKIQVDAQNDAMDMTINQYGAGYIKITEIEQ